MQSGKISPGNAGKLVELLDSTHNKRLGKHLHRHKSRAVQKGCDRLLLSNETLYERLADPDRLNLLHQSASKAGFDSVECIVFVRDPIEQALSLYKHRLKSRDCGTISEWLRSEYREDEKLLKFLRNVRDSEAASSTARRYTRQTEIIESRLFGEWLGMGTLPEQPDGDVNRSLSLSELAVIRPFHSLGPQAGLVLHRYFQRLAPRSDTDRGNLEQAAREEIAAYLAPRNSFWVEINQHLSQAEAIDIPEAPLRRDTRQPEIRLSPAQLEVLAEAVSELLTVRFRLRSAFDNHLRPALSRLKWGVYGLFRPVA